MLDVLQPFYEYTDDIIAAPPGRNGLGSYDAFEARKAYQVIPYFGDLPAPLRSWYQQLYFGRVDRVQNGVVPKQDTSLLKQIKGQETSNVLVFNFVADAFKDLRLHMERAGNAGLITRESFYYKIEALSSFEPYKNQRKGVLDFIAQRLNQRINLSNTIYNRVTGFVPYIDELLNFYKTGKIEVPTTLTGYVVSRYSDQYMSGLSISLVEEDNSVDRVKVQTYILDPNFRCFVLTARMYGFYVDRNMPWRIVANPFSEPMLRYLGEYGVASGTPMGVTAARFFPYYYDKTYPQDIQDLKETLMKMYNDYAEAHPGITETPEATIRCPDKLALVKQLREPVTLSDLNDLGDSYWLDLYFKLRIQESSLRIDDYHKRILKVIEIYSAQGIDKAVKSINDQIKPYLYEKDIGLKLTAEGGPVRIGQVGEQTYTTSNPLAQY